MTENAIEPAGAEPASHAFRSSTFLETDCEPAGARSIDHKLPKVILAAFHQACDKLDFEVAASLVSIAESMLCRERVTLTSCQKARLDMVVAAHERLWNLRMANPDKFEAARARSALTAATSML